MRCKTCQHPQRQAIDLALLEGNATLWDMSEQYGLSTSSLFRHKKHLELQMARAQEKLQHRQRQDILFQYNEFLQDARQLARTAKEEGNTRLALQATSVGARILNSITKLDVQLDADTTYRLLASPQWTTQDSLFPTDLQFRAACHQSLASEFFSPCPDISPGHQEHAHTQQDVPPPTQLETRNPELETQNDPDPKSQREISAKLPRNSRSGKENSQQTQLDNQCEKSFAQNVAVGPDSDSHPTNLMGNETPPMGMPECAPAAKTASLETRNSELETSPAPSSLFPGASPTATPLETQNPELENLPPFLTPEMRRQIFTPLFPNGDGARDPGRIPAPAKIPPLPPPQKTTKLNKFLHFFRKKPNLPPEAAACDPAALSAFDHDAEPPDAPRIPFPFSLFFAIPSTDGREGTYEATFPPSTAGPKGCEATFPPSKGG